MKQKIYALCLTLAFVMSIAVSAFAFEIEGDPIVDEETGETFTYTFTTSGDLTDPQWYEDFEATATEGVAGYNYYAEIQLPIMNLHESYEYESNYYESDIPETSMDIKWDIETDAGLSGLKKYFSEDGKILILNGILPETTNSYNFYVTAEITGVSDENYSLAIGMKATSDAFTIDVTEDTDHTLVTDGASFDERVNPNKDINNVTPDYKVVVTAPYKTLRYVKSYTEYIQSDDSYAIDLPYWLTYTTEIENEKIISATITFNSEVDVNEIPEGATGVVRVPFADTENYATITLGWNVTYKAGNPTPTPEENPFHFTVPVNQTFELEAGKGTELLIDYEGSKPTKYKISEDVEGFKDNITVKPTVPNVETENSHVKLTITAKADAKAGTYSATLFFYDSNEISDSAKITVKVKGSETPNPAPASDDKKPNPTPASEDKKPEPAPASDDEKPNPTPTPTPTPEVISNDERPAPITSNDVRPNPNDGVNSEDSRPIESQDVRPVSNDVRPNPSSNDNNNSNSTQGQQIKSASAAFKPSALLNPSYAAKRNIANALGIDFAEGEELKSPTPGNSRTIDDEDVKNLIASRFSTTSQDLKVVVLPLLTFESGVNVFAVSHSDFENADFKTGQKIYIVYQIVSDSDVSAGIFASAENEFKLVNSEGKEITEFPTDSTEDVNVVAYIETPAKYSMLLSSIQDKTAASTTATPTITVTSDDVKTIGRSGAGCDTGINAATLLILAAAFVIRRKSH